MNEMIPKTAIKLLLEKYGDVFHEWNSQSAGEFFERSGIFKRNWRILMRHEGLADGRVWTYREIAGAEGISHVRAYQIVCQTKKNLIRLVTKMKAT